MNLEELQQDINVAKRHGFPYHSIKGTDLEAMIALISRQESELAEAREAYENRTIVANQAINDALRLGSSEASAPVAAMTDPQIDDLVFKKGIQSYAYVDDPSGWRAFIRELVAAPQQHAQAAEGKDGAIYAAVALPEKTLSEEDRQRLYREALAKLRAAESDSRVTGNAQAALSDADILVQWEIVKDSGRFHSMAIPTDTAIVAFARAILAARQPALVASAPAVTVPVDAKTCKECHGIGTYIGQNDGYDDADCHICDGSGKAPQPAAAPVAAAVQGDAVQSLLTVFDMGLGFALCHRDFGDTRNAIKNLQKDFTAIRVAVGQRAASQDSERDEALSQAAADVLAERQRQLNVEGFHAGRDDRYVKGELGLAASAYACTASPDMRLEWIPGNWPWGANWYKPKSKRQNMVKAGALILAEIERIDRLAAQPHKKD